MRADDVDDDSELNAEGARALLERASQVESTVKSGASWPQVASLLSLGAASSLALPAIAYAPSSLLALPMTLMMVWIAAAFVFMITFGRSVKRGFGRRWVATMLSWGVCWVIGIFGITVWFVDQTWFLIVACAALTAVTLIGAWLEARR